MKKILLTLSLMASAASAEITNGERIALIGDSITFHSCAFDGGFHTQLTNALARLMPQKGVEVVPLGLSGITYGVWKDWLRTLENRTFVMTYGPRREAQDVKVAFSNRIDTVSIFLGMNDILQPTVIDDEESLNKWAATAKGLIAEVRRRANPKRFILCTITPLTADPTSPKNLVRERMNKKLRELAKAEGATVAEFGNAIAKLQELSTTWRTDYRIVPDFVHPNSVGHTALVMELCRALGDEQLVKYFKEKLQGELDALAAKESREPFAVRLWPQRKYDPAAKELNYRLTYSTKLQGKVKVTPPKGWHAQVQKNEVLLRGAPTKAMNVVTLSIGTNSYDVAIPSPWRVSAPFDFIGIWHGQNWKTNTVPPVAFKDATGWQLATGTWNYTAANTEGSIDPYQLFFGDKYDSFYATKRVWSEKAREVNFEFSHGTFSGTFGIVLTVNGEQVCCETMDRRGRNKVVVRGALKEGWNEIVMRVDHANWQRQLALKLTPIEGDTLEELRYDWRSK